VGKGGKMRGNRREVARENKTTGGKVRGNRRKGERGQEKG
jgi:hypothetical protein